MTSDAIRGFDASWSAPPHPSDASDDYSFDPRGRRSAPREAINVATDQLSGGTTMGDDYFSTTPGADDLARSSRGTSISGSVSSTITMTSTASGRVRKPSTMGTHVPRKRDPKTPQQKAKNAANQKTARDKKKREDEGKNTRIEFLDNMVEDLQTKVSTLETTVTELNTSKAELEVRNAKLEAEIARLKGGTTAPSSFDSNLQSSSENALLDSRNNPHAADGTEFFGPADLAQAVTGPDALDQDATALFSQHGTGGSFLYDWELQRYFNDSIPVASDVHTASNVPEDLQGMGPERSSENATFSPTMMDRNPLESHSLPQGVSTWSAVPGTVAYQQAYTTPSFAQQWSGSQANSDISVPVCATIGKNENLPNSRAARVTLQNLDKDERLEFETTFDPMRRALLAGRAASRKRRARGNVNQ